MYEWNIKILIVEDCIKNDRMQGNNELHIENGKLDC